MCGIFCCVRKHSDHDGDDEKWPDEELTQLLHCRGPDATGRHECSTPGYTATFHSTVLSLRGENVTEQPLRRADVNATLCWNGEAWSIAGQPTHGNDTEQIFDLLKTASKAEVTGDLDRRALVGRSAQTVSRRLSQVAGPYAFVFHDENNEVLYFGRDFLGRRSLLRSAPFAGTLLLSSVTDSSPASQWTEVEADGIYFLDLQDSSLEPQVVPYRFIEDDVKDDNSTTSVIPHLSLNKDISFTPPVLHQDSPSVLEIEAHLRRALELRILNIPDPPLRSNNTSHPPARLAILFSGGLDCTLLAALSHHILPPTEPIDLLNVAFENPRIHKDPSDPNLYSTCPDRITGLTSLSELQTLYPTRSFRFVSINIPYTETVSHKPLVTHLMSPHKTEMDLSICLALFFAARGTGTMLDADDDHVHVPSTSSARILLSGLGADELFAGYTRHATAFRRRGMEGLVEEMELDLGRVGRRNLGRDDRVMAYWGREVRFPFLDEGVVAGAVGMRVWEKCDFGARLGDVGGGGSGGGDGRELESGKKVLRCLAWRLGMRGVAREKKRAIQFGSRTAKMESGRTKGTQILD